MDALGRCGKIPLGKSRHVKIILTIVRQNFDMDFSSKILMFFFEVACASLLRAHAAGPY